MLIETERLILRPIVGSDLDDLVALGSDPQVTEFVSRLDRASAEQRISLAEREWSERGYGMLAVVQRSGERFLGRAWLTYWPQFDETEVGWVLRRDAWGQGYATEAGGACVEWGFAEFALSYMTAMIQPANQRSIRVAERLGFAPAREDALNGDPVIVFARPRADERAESVRHGSRAGQARVPRSRITGDAASNALPSPGHGRPLRLRNARKAGVRMRHASLPLRTTSDSSTRRQLTTASLRLRARAGHRGRCCQHLGRRRVIRCVTEQQRAGTSGASQVRRGASTAVNARLNLQEDFIPSAIPSARVRRRHSTESAS